MAEGSEEGKEIGGGGCLCKYLDSKIRSLNTPIAISSNVSILKDNSKNIFHSGFIIIINILHDMTINSLTQGFEAQIII